MRANFVANALAAATLSGLSGSGKAQQSPQRVGSQSTYGSTRLIFIGSFVS